MCLSWRQAHQSCFCLIFWFAHQGVSTHRGGHEINLKGRMRLQAESHLIWLLWNCSSCMARGQCWWFVPPYCGLDRPIIFGWIPKKLLSDNLCFRKMSFNDFNNHMAATRSMTTRLKFLALVSKCLQTIDGLSCLSHIHTAFRTFFFLQKNLQLTNTWFLSKPTNYVSISSKPYVNC